MEEMKLGWTLLTEKSAPNFCNEAGKAYMVRCPECKKENYAMDVATGICTWCGYDLNENKVIRNEITKS